MASSHRITAIRRCRAQPKRPGRLRGALGDAALRIDHIGSTAVPALAAKPVIDIQISVAAPDPVGPFCEPLRQLGYVYRGDNTERTKRYFLNHRASRAPTSMSG